FLEHAAPGYLDDHEWSQSPEDWLEQAGGYTAAPRHGVPGPLTRVRPRPGDPPVNAGGQPCYKLADYLEQAGRSERAAIFPPGSFWDAVAVMVTDAEVLREFAQQAFRRGRYRRAYVLYHTAADRADGEALVAVVRLREQVGDGDGAVA